MDREGVIQMIYNKPRVVGFQFDKLWHPPMLNYISQSDIGEILSISQSVKLNAQPLKKYQMVDGILYKRGFTRLHAGTNRLVYKNEYDSSFCLKIGIDKVGREANVGEYYTQNILKPFCTKVFEVSQCGTVAMVERVNALKNRYQFEDVADIIFNIIIAQFAGIVLEDVGTNFFLNWGIRDGFGPVVLDFPYAYEADISKMKCIQKNKLGVQCDGLIDYDDGLNNIICTKCGTRYTARELRKYYSDRHVVETIKNSNPKGEIDMSKFDVSVSLLQSDGTYKETEAYTVDKKTKFKDWKGKRVYPKPPKAFRKTYDPIVEVEFPTREKTAVEEAVEEAKKSIETDIDVSGTVEVSVEPEEVKTDISGEIEVDEDGAPCTQEEPKKQEENHTEIPEPEEEANKEAVQTPLTYMSNNSRTYNENVKEEGHEEEEEIEMTAEQKNELDNAYSSALCEALDTVLHGDKDISKATAEEMQEIVHTTCVYIVRYCSGKFNEKEIQEYIKNKVIADINDANSDEIDNDRKIDIAPIRNIDNF